MWARAIFVLSNTTVLMHQYIYIYIYMCVCVCVNIATLTTKCTQSYPVNTATVILLSIDILNSKWFNTSTSTVTLKTLRKTAQDQVTTNYVYNSWDVLWFIIIRMLVLAMGVSWLPDDWRLINRSSHNNFKTLKYRLYYMLMLSNADLLIIHMLQRVGCH